MFFHILACFQSNPSVAEPEQKDEMENVSGSVADDDQACKIFFLLFSDLIVNYKEVSDV
jgi:hypothetical protein